MNAEQTTGYARVRTRSVERGNSPFLKSSGGLSKSAWSATTRTTAVRRSPIIFPDGDSLLVAAPHPAHTTGTSFRRPL